MYLITNHPKCVFWSVSSYGSSDVKSKRSANTAIAESKHPTFSPNTNLYTSIAKVKHTCCVYEELDNLLETVRGMFMN